VNESSVGIADQNKSARQFPDSNEVKLREAIKSVINSPTVNVIVITQYYLPLFNYGTISEE
jgi:hypothetical protein